MSRSSLVEKEPRLSSGQRALICAEEIAHYRRNPDLLPPDLRGGHGSALTTTIRLRHGLGMTRVSQALQILKHGTREDVEAVRSGRVLVLTMYNRLLRRVRAAKGTAAAVPTAPPPRPSMPAREPSVVIQFPPPAHPAPLAAGTAGTDRAAHLGQGRPASSACRPA